MHGILVFSDEVVAAVMCASNSPLFQRETPQSPVSQVEPTSRRHLWDLELRAIVSELIQTARLGKHENLSSFTHTISLQQKCHLFFYMILARIPVNSHVLHVIFYKSGDFCRLWNSEIFPSFNAFYTICSHFQIATKLIYVLQIEVNSFDYFY